MAWTEVDLVNDVVWPELWPGRFYIPGFVLADTTYEFQVDFDTAVSVETGASHLSAESLRADGDPDLSARFFLGVFEDVSSPAQGILTVGPGIEAWGDARAAGETNVLFSVYYNPDASPITGLRWSVTLLAPVGTDTTSDVSLGYGYEGTADVGDNLTPDPVPAEVRVAPIRRVHVSLPAPTLVNGRPT